jgi:hypothetical protein
MAEVSGPNFTLSKVASGDLRGHQFRFVRASGAEDIMVFTTRGAYSVGVLQNKPNDNEHATLVTLGHTKVRVASLGPNIWVMANSDGCAVEAGSGQVVLGRLITGATSGALGEMILNVSHAGSL